jgi:asparagine synthase (glutamine-hydrolysing)
MCGIAGIISQNCVADGQKIVKMTDAMIHRGPDDWGYVALDPNLKNLPTRQKEVPTLPAKVMLGHRRLSIIDISGSAQPLCNKTSQIWVTFNGEIYNYKELRKSLILKGHHFREDGDTEVLVHLWEEYAENMVEHLVGMFAFAIYDRKKNTLFLARDRFGQKPLFYMEHNGIFAFASELQALKQLEEFPVDSIDNIAMAQYFRYGYIPSPHTIYKNVSSLEPGHYLLKTDDHSSIASYWKPEVTGTETDVDLEELQELIDRAVKSRLNADVPLGAFLSGGIDSSLITASMARQTSKKVESFTISTGNSWCDESKEAQLIADYIGTEHHTFNVAPDFIEISAKLAKHYGQPFADPSSVLTYYVSRETGKHVTVALAGDGGDELFGGYGSYLNSAKYAFFGNLPNFARPFIANLANPFLRNSQPNIKDAILAARNIPEKGENISGLFHDYWRESAFSEELKNNIKSSADRDLDRFISFFNSASSDDPIDRWMEADQRMYLPDDILTKVDIASMSVSLECRAPFLDHKIAEFANKISSRTKLKNNRTKFLLKELAAKQLPEQIVNLPKKGFSMPLGEWMKSELKDWSHSVIFDNREQWEPYLKNETVKLMWNQHQSGKVDHSSRLWQIAVLSMN